MGTGDGELRSLVPDRLAFLLVALSSRKLSAGGLGENVDWTQTSAYTKDFLIYRLILGVIATFVLTTSARAQAEYVTPSAMEVQNLTVARETLGALRMLALKYHVVIGVYGTWIGVYVGDIGRDRLEVWCVFLYGDRD